MNVYRCWYQGISGFACRSRQKRWLFVPDFGQPDTHAYKNVQLPDLHFHNLIEKRNEIEFEAAMQETSLARRLGSRLLRRTRPASIYGQLLLPD